MLSVWHGEQATHPSGIGIAKPDVRLVAHTQLPGTLDAYYREAGRAGRDGAPSGCVAFHGPNDMALARGFTARSHPPAEVLREVHRALRECADAAGEVVLGADRAQNGFPGACAPEQLRGALLALARGGGVRILGDLGALDGTGDGPDGSQSLRVGVLRSARFAPAMALRRGALEKPCAVRRCAASRGCRRRSLLRSERGSGFLRPQLAALPSSSWMNGERSAMSSRSSSSILALMPRSEAVSLIVRRHASSHSSPRKMITPTFFADVDDARRVASKASHFDGPWKVTPPGEDVGSGYPELPRPGAVRPLRIGFSLGVIPAARTASSGRADTSGWCFGRATPPAVLTTTRLGSTGGRSGRSARSRGHPLRPRPICPPRTRSASA